MESEWSVPSKPCSQSLSLREWWSIFAEIEGVSCQFNQEPQKPKYHEKSMNPL